MKKYLPILRSKIFWYLVCFALASVSLLLGSNLLGGLFMIYPVVLTLIGIVYGAILNPLRERQDLKRYLSYSAHVTGQVVCNGQPVPLAKVVIGYLDGTHDTDTRNYYTLSDESGHFKIPHVKDGDFICQSWKTGNGQSLTGHQEIKISDSKSIDILINMIES